MKNNELYLTAVEELEDMNAIEPEMPEFREELREESHGTSTYVFEKDTNRLFAVIEVVSARRGGLEHIVTFTQSNYDDGYFDTEVLVGYDEAIEAVNAAYRWEHL